MGNFRASPSSREDVRQTETQPQAGSSEEPRRNESSAVGIKAPNIVEMSPPEGDTKKAHYFSFINIPNL